MKRNAVVILCAILLVACSGKSPAAPIPPTVTGNWQGTVGTQVLTLSLSQSGGTVTGNGTLTNTPTGTRAITANGTFTDPVLSMTLGSGGTLTPFNLTATLTKSGALIGNLQGSGFTGELVTLSRQ